MAVTSEQIEVRGYATQCLMAGTGPPMVLLHGAGESAADWQWVMPALAEQYRVLAPDLPGSLGCTLPDGVSLSAYFATFVGRFLDTLQVSEAVVIGNSFGGLIALQFALDKPQRVAALGLVDSLGLGQEINPMIRWLVSPGVGELEGVWSVTIPGCLSRAWMRAGLYFARPSRTPDAWISEQQRLAQQPGFLPSWVEALRTIVGPGGQREVMLDRLLKLTMPTLLVWGDRDGVVPHCHAAHALERLSNGRLRLLADCGHFPQIEQPEAFIAAVRQFLTETMEYQPDLATDPA